VFDEDGIGYVTKDQYRRMLNAIYSLYDCNDFSKGIQLHRAHYSHLFIAEVNIFVEMAFQIGNSNRDKKLNFKDFKEAALLQVNTVQF
jgi:hypothetical protein